MKALTILQPYAHLIASGQKRVENRDWPTRYRGPLAIHAGKSRAWLMDGHLEEFLDMRFGAVVAIANLIDCIRLGSKDAEKYPWLEAHPHAHGPWMWILDDVQPLPAPIPFKGAQGLWEYPEQSREKTK